jgi:hypothetical protein
MTLSTAATHTTPPALITHSVLAIRGAQHADLSVHHARTSDARISVTFSGILMVLYSCHAAQGLLEAFSAARGHIAQLPRELPPGPAPTDEPVVRTTIAIDWTRAPAYAVTAQTGRNKFGATVHWVDLYTGPLTWQIRDQAALVSTIDALRHLHRTAVAVFPDGDTHAADPSEHDLRAG